MRFDHEAVEAASAGSDDGGDVDRAVVFEASERDGKTRAPGEIADRA